MSEQRQHNIRELRRDGAFDVVVIGGGINGIGVFRDLALQGLRVLLVERNDFCSGCSSAPSRMIHGGLRYLENGEFSLVSESLRERDALLADAPHMVRPLPTTVPIKTVFSGLLNGAAAFLGLSTAPSSRGAVAIKIGLLLYDLKTRYRQVLPRHVFNGAASTRQQWPELAEEFRFTATYHDAWISHPERLGVELLLDTADLSPGSIALNYAEIMHAGDGLTLTTIEGDSLPVTAKAIVNATGAWLDEAVSSLGGAMPDRPPFVSGTKGSHLVLDNKRLLAALAGNMIFFEHTDGRVCIAFPYLGKVLAGATDIRVDRPQRVRCEPDEMDYILSSLQRVFPGVPMAKTDVVYSFSGIRPLPRSDQEFTGRISRGHFTQRLNGAIPQFCMVGGKWTTFRAFAEQTADAVLAELGVQRRMQTNGLKIGGGAGFAGGGGELRTELIERYAVTPARAEHLAFTYGTRAIDVMDFCVRRQDDVPLDPTTEITAAEIVFLIQNEMVLRLADLIQRRTALAIQGVVSAGLIERISSILALELGHDAARQRQEQDEFIADIAQYHGVSPEMLEQRTKTGVSACG